MRIVIIDTAYPINYRNRKLADSFSKKRGNEVFVIAWNRESHLKALPNNYYVFSSKSEYGNKWKKAAKLLGFRRYCISKIQELNPSLVIASHWETLALVPRLDRSRQKLIYENLDIPTGNPLERRIASLIERQELRRVDLTIFASRFFPLVYPKNLPSFVLENKPNAGIEPVAKEQTNTLVISYIGVLRYFEVVKNLIDAVRNDDRFILYFRGGGDGMKAAMEYSCDAKNIVFTGYYEHSAISSFYAESDIVWAVYPSNDFNVKYAISNKFHESLKYGVPCMYANGTKLAEYVMANGIGIGVDSYDTNQIKDTLIAAYSGQIQLGTIRKKMLQVGTNMSSWEEDFDKLYTRILQLF